VNILELVPATSDVLQIAWMGQRTYWEEEGAEVRQIHTARKKMGEVADALIAACAVKKPDLILVRGFELLQGVFRTDIHKAAPIVLDHCTPTYVDSNHPLMAQLHRLSHVLCYSEQVAASYRKAGYGRVKTMGGPYLPSGCRDAVREGPLRVAVLNTCQSASQVLIRVASLNAEKGWGAHIYSPMKAVGSQQVGSNFEAAELAQLVIAPFEETDMGQPHEGAILALGIGRALATSRTMAMDNMPFPSGSYILCPRYAIGSYAAAIPTFAGSPEKFSGWVDKAKVNLSEIPKTILGWGGYGLP
jgi:hypothetical protein